MADALTGKTEVDATVEEIVSTRIQEVLTDAMVAWPLMMDFSPQVGPGMDKLKIPRFGNFTVDSKTENTAVDAQVNAFSTDDLDLDQHKVVQFLIEDIADLQAKIAVVSAYIDQAARDLAAEMDATLLADLDANPSTVSPDHDVKYNDTVNNDLEKIDITEARRLLDVQNVPKADRWGIIPPDKEKDLLNISEFVRVDESGGSAALRNGQIGRLFGFDIVMSNQLNTAGSSLWGHSSAAAVARQMQPRVEQDRDLPNLADRHSISHLYGTHVLDSGKRFVRFTET